MSLDEVGCVVIGRNEGERLTSCLKSLKPAAKVVVYVDSGSTDGSVLVAERLGAIVVRLDKARPFTAARARNEGFARLMALHPDFQYVQFIDGDCELVPGWLDIAITFLAQRPDVAVVCGRRRERHPEASLYNRLCDVEWNTPVGQALACGGDSLMRAAAFEAVGGFRPQLIAGEEPELCIRLREQGWKIWRLGADMTWHDAAIKQFRQWWARTVRGGYGYIEVARLHQGRGSAIWIRESARAVLWGGLLPLAIAVGTLFHSTALCALVLYPLQIGRIAWSRGLGELESWTYGSFITLAKFAELQGILKFYGRRWRGRGIQLIEYKGSQ
jgi:glycosyltransferase involved in cell wall biosynthesis